MDSIHTISENVVSYENQQLFNLLCRELSQGPKISIFFYDEVKQSSKNEYFSCIAKKSGDFDREEIGNNNNQDSLIRFSLSDLQRKILTYSSDKSYFKEVEALDPKLILSDCSLVIRDDVLQAALERSATMDSASAFVFAKMVILPKLNSNEREVSDTIGDLLRELFLTHEQAMADGALRPLLSFGRTSSHLFRHLLAQDIHLITINSFVMSLSKKECLDETDTDTFLCLFERLQPTDPDSRQAALEFLERNSSHFATSVKFGRCILKFMQKMGAFLSSRENLSLIVASHKSSMRKTLETHLRKIK